MKTLTLANGDHLPTLGLGLWKIARSETANMVYSAIECGYRHLDSACDYGNEKEAGEGIANALRDRLCSREDLWVTSKLWNTYHRKEHVRPAFERTLSDLGLEYLDLYLIHFPIALEYVPMNRSYPPGWLFDEIVKHPEMKLAKVPILETWQAMEQLKQEGLVKNIGVCNFGVSLLQDLMNSSDEMPSVLQVERHPYLEQQKLLRFCQRNDIVLTGFSPLGAGSYLELGMAKAEDTVLEESCIRKIASAHSKTPAQVVLRWGIQQGTAVIPKTSKSDRLMENLNVYDFSLTDTEMQTISSLDRHQRFNDPGVFCESAFNTFCPIYE
jgi:D-xylose reductase